MKKEVFAINGTGGVGKDTFIEFCEEFVEVKNISSVDKIKEAAKVLGWTGSKEEKDRKMLSDLKKLSVDYNEGPTNYIVNEFEKFKQSNERIMFVHVREAEEIDKLKNLINCKTLLITSKRINIIISNRSDGLVLEYKYDEEIKNDGTLEELKENAKEFLNKYELI